jgi:hypothetical protein
MDQPREILTLPKSAIEPASISAQGKSRRALLWSELPEAEMVVLEKAVDAYLEGQVESYLMRSKLII